MPKNDVVKHDLVVGEAIDWDADMQPMELPSQPEAPDAKPLLADPPTDTMIDGRVLTETPYRSVGKMGLRFVPETTLYGSGWVVAKKAFITAGHCVYYRPKGGWIIRAEFCPRFNVACEKGWKVSAVYTLQGWLDGDWAYDLAACVVTEDFGDTEPPVAFQTFTVPALEYAAIGYPMDPTSNHDFNGKRMWQSYGKFLKLENDRLYAENDFTHGASGGPWLEASESDDVGGITSSRSGDDPNIAKSPLFVEGFRNLYDAVKDL